MPRYQLQTPKVPENEYGFGYVGQIGPVVSEFDFGYIGLSPIEWRAKEYAKCMASNSFAEADAWLDEIGRELKVARHWLAVAKSLEDQEGAK